MRPNPIAKIVFVCRPAPERCCAGAANDVACPRETRVVSSAHDRSLAVDMAQTQVNAAMRTRQIRHGGMAEIIDGETQP